MDINLSGMNGIEAPRRIVSAAPATAVVLISTYALDDLPEEARRCGGPPPGGRDRKSTRLKSSHMSKSYAAFCLKKKKQRMSAPEPREHQPTAVTPSTSGTETV